MREWSPTPADADRTAISGRLAGVNGQGRRRFDNLRPEHIELERPRILVAEGGVTHVTTASGAERSALIIG